MRLSRKDFKRVKRVVRLGSVRKRLDDALAAQMVIIELSDYSSPARERAGKGRRLQGEGMIA